MTTNHPVDVICHPECPGKNTSMMAILKALDYVLLPPDRPTSDLVIAWEDTTFPKVRQHPPSRWGIPPINGRCSDISKQHVDAVKSSVFGYGLALDPTAHTGTCFVKSNENARHDGKLVECPIAAPVANRVYQRFVDTLQPEGYYEDIRIAVIGNEVPVCWRRIKSAESVTQRMGDYDRSIPVPAETLLSADEMALVLKLSKALGLDFVEYDGGRDRSDGRLYVYDANSTPIVRLDSSTEDERQLAIAVLSAAFARQFRPQITYAVPV